MFDYKLSKTLVALGCASLISLSACESRTEKVNREIQEGDREVAEAVREAEEDTARARMQFEEKRQEAVEDVAAAREQLHTEQAKAADAVGEQQAESEREINDAIVK